MFLGMSRARIKLPPQRRIAGLDAIEEAVGRATEMGKMVFFTPGFGDVAGVNAAPSLAGIDVLSYVAQLTARSDTELGITVGHPNVYTLVQEVTKNAYANAGKLDAFSDEMITFTSEIQFAFTAASLGVMQREKPAAVMFIGVFAAEAIILSEAAVAAGAISIAGSTNIFQIPFFVAACDYTMIGEEFLAAGAFISQDPQRIGAVAGQDFIKLVAVLLVLGGALLTTFNVHILRDLLRR